MLGTAQAMPNMYNSMKDRTAVVVASDLPGGPAHLRLPRNILYGKVKSGYSASDALNIPMHIRPNPREVGQAARILIESQSPLMYAGFETYASEAQRKTPGQWQATIDDIIGRGAKIFVEEGDEIAGYLGKNLRPGAPMPPGLTPPLDLNSGLAEEITKVLKLDSELAQAIVACRQNVGAFETL